MVAICSPWTSLDTQPITKTVIKTVYSDIIFAKKVPTRTTARSWYGNLSNDKGGRHDTL